MRPKERLIDATKAVAYWTNKVNKSPDDNDFVNTLLFWQKELHDMLDDNDYRDEVDSYNRLIR